MVPALGRATLLSTLAALLALALFVVADHYMSTIDSIYLLRGASQITRCVNDGDIPRCHSGVWSVSFFALAQYLPAMLLNSLALGGDLGLQALTWISYVAFVGVIAIIWIVCSARSGRGAAALGVVAVLSSQMLFYADGAWGEPLAALLIAVFAACLLTGARAWMIALAFVMAGVTKDVAPLLLLMLAAAALAPGWADLESARRRVTLIALATGLAGAVALNASFNYFRFGHLVNQVYGDAASQRVDLGAWPGKVLAAVASPNAGVIAGWPVAVILIATVAAVSVSRASGGRRLIAAAPALFLAAVLVGFSGYFAPFGWFAWMNRFTVPWIPAIVMVSLAADPPAARAALRQLSGSAATAIIAVVAVVSFGTGAGAITSMQRESLSWLFAADTECPVLSDLDQGSHRYADCQMHIAWERTPVTAKALPRVLDADALPLTLLGALSCVLLCGYARRDLRLVHSPSISRGAEAARRSTRSARWRRRPGRTSA
jgi:hypothetical protein